MKKKKEKRIEKKKEKRNEIKKKKRKWKELMKTFFFLFLFNIYFYKIENILLLYFLIKN
jgi:hypothetical protein